MSQHATTLREAIRYMEAVIVPSLKTNPNVNEDVLRGALLMLKMIKMWHNANFKTQQYDVDGLKRSSKWPAK